MISLLLLLISTTLVHAIDCDESYIKSIRDTSIELIKDGWTKGKFENSSENDPKTYRCLMGAILEANELKRGSHLDFSSFIKLWKVLNLKSVNDSLRTDYGIELITEFNDHEDTSLEMVITSLEKIDEKMCEKSQ